MKKLFGYVLLLCLMARGAVAGWFEDWSQQTWEEAKYVWRNGGYDMYVPLYAWHNRLAYDDEHIAKYNENAFGFGLGKSVYDEAGNWYGLYAFAFKDSNYELETVAGTLKNTLGWSEEEIQNYIQQRRDQYAR